MKGIMCRLPLLGCMSAALLTAVSCSVKEDRNACPCYVYVFVDEFVRAGFAESVVNFNVGDSSSSETIELARYTTDGYVRTVPRGTAEVSLVAGISSSIISGGIVMTEYGRESDPLWLSTDSVVCSGDELYITPEPNKQFCRLTLVLLSPDGEPTEDDFILKVSGSCNGIDIYTGKAVPGNFCAEATKTGSGVYTVRIPRQLDSELTLEIIEENQDEEISCIVDLGKEFMTAGYDWQRTSLLDVGALVDYSNSTVEVSIEDWEKDDSYNEIEI